MAKRLAQSDRATQAAGSRLKAARLAAGYADPIDFYLRFGIKQGTYGNHEKGSRAFDTATAQLYADKLGNVTAGWLLTGEGDPPRAMDAKPSLGKRATLIEPQVDSDPKKKALDKKLMFLWESLDPDIQVVALSVIEALSALRPKAP